MKSRRAVLVGSAALSALTGCSGLPDPPTDASNVDHTSSSPNPTSSTTGQKDRNDNGCPDRVEGFTVSNWFDEPVTIGVIVSRVDGREVFERNFELQPDSTKSPNEPVFTSDDSQYHIKATYEEYQLTKTIEGLPCDERHDRFVSVNLGRYESLHIDIEHGASPA